MSDFELREGFRSFRRQDVVAQVREGSESLPLKVGTGRGESESLGDLRGRLFPERFLSTGRYVQRALNLLERMTHIDKTGDVPRDTDTHSATERTEDTLPVQLVENLDSLNGRRDQSQHEEGSSNHPHQSISTYDRSSDSPSERIDGRVLCDLNDTLDDVLLIQKGQPTRTRSNMTLHTT